MLTDPYAWLDRLIARLRAALPGRVLFVGLQGSYRRGEANENSDIDVVTVLDHVDRTDLDRYQAAVRAMPQGELACGFLCGRNELLRWPRFDLLQLVLDTQPRFGSLEALLPPFSPADTDQAVKVGASALYHAAVHCYLYEADRAAALPALAKSVFFLLRLRVFRDTGRYCLTKAELSGLVSAEEAALLAFCRSPDVPAPDGADGLYGLLLRWSSALLA